MEYLLEKMQQTIAYSMIFRTFKTNVTKLKSQLSANQKRQIQRYSLVSK